MMNRTYLRRELAVASRRLTIALRIHRRLTRLRTGNSTDVALPPAPECCELIENCTAEYLAVLTRYCAAWEETLPRKPEPVAPRADVHSENTARVRYGVRWPARSNAALMGRKQRVG